MIPAFSTFSGGIYQDREKNKLPRMKDEKKVIGTYSGVLGKQSEESQYATGNACRAEPYNVYSPKAFVFADTIDGGCCCEYEQKQSCAYGSQDVPKSCSAGGRVVIAADE